MLACLLFVCEQRGKGKAGRGRGRRREVLTNHMPIQALKWIRLDTPSLHTYSEKRVPTTSASILTLCANIGSSIHTCRRERKFTSSKKNKIIGQCSPHCKAERGIQPLSHRLGLLPDRIFRVQVGWTTKLFTCKQAITFCYTPIIHFHTGIKKLVLVKSGA